MEKKGKPGCLGYVGDGVLTQFCGDSIKLLLGSLLNNEREWKVRPVFFRPLAPEEGSRLDPCKPSELGVSDAFLGSNHNCCMVEIRHLRLGCPVVTMLWENAKSCRFLYTHTFRKEFNLSRWSK